MNTQQIIDEILKIKEVNPKLSCENKLEIQKLQQELNSVVANPINFL
jgi:hypothetical protein